MPLQFVSPGRQIAVLVHLLAWGGFAVFLWRAETQSEAMAAAVFLGLLVLIEAVAKTMTPLEIAPDPSKDPVGTGAKSIVAKSALTIFLSSSFVGLAAALGIYFGRPAVTLDRSLVAAGFFGGFVLLGFIMALLRLRSGRDSD